MKYIERIGVREMSEGIFQCGERKGVTKAKGHDEMGTFVFSRSICIKD